MTSQLIIEQLVLFVIIEILKGEFFSLIENKFQYILEFLFFHNFFEFSGSWN
jgi:hypothetical protein